MNKKKPRTIFGQDVEILLALWANIVSWFFATFAPNYTYILLPSCSAEDKNAKNQNQTRCIAIGRPGGLEQLRLITLKENTLTVGYNLRNISLPPFAVIPSSINDTNSAVPSDCVILRNQYFSVNYADCTIRWGLYESAKQYVGYPIVPGFDVAGVVECVGDSADDEPGKFQKGDRVFGCTLFGAYSDRVLIPKLQLRKIPDGISTKEAAAIPAVSLQHYMRTAGRCLSCST